MFARRDKHSNARVRIRTHMARAFLCVYTLFVQIIHVVRGKKTFYSLEYRLPKCRKSASWAFPDTPAKIAKNKPSHNVIAFHPRLRRRPVILRYRRLFRSGHIFIFFTRTVFNFAKLLISHQRHSRERSRRVLTNSTYQNITCEPECWRTYTRRQKQTIVYFVRLKHENLIEWSLNGPRRTGDLKALYVVRAREPDELKYVYKSQCLKEKKRLYQAVIGLNWNSISAEHAGYCRTEIFIKSVDVYKDLDIFKNQPV